MPHVFYVAIFVVVTHLVQLGFINNASAYYIPDLGRESVMIFFVLSGYVIAYSVKNKNLSAKTYTIARASRIYSVALPCLLLAFLSIYLLETLTENSPSQYQVAKAYIYIPFHNLFLGELWTLTERPPRLTPYWSLSYEVWYYILFGVFYFSTGLARIVLTSLVLMIMGYKLWLLLPIWLSGAFLFRYQSKFTIKKLLARYLWLGTIIILCIYKLLDLDLYLRGFGNKIWPFENFPLGSSDRFLSDYVVCILVLLNFYTALYSQFTLITHYRSIIQKFAVYTFTLYLLHYLVMKIWSQVISHNPNSMIDISLLIVTIAISTYIVGFFTENKRHHLTAFFEHISHAIYRIVSKINISKTKAT